jgi:outer membrane protein OmpA-like peptidoglycan-associated protein
MKRDLLKVMAFCSIFLLMAEEATTAQDNDSLTKVTFIDNTSLEGSLGAQMLFSDGASELDPAQRFTPAFSLSAGKWLSPYWGLQMKFDGLSLNGFTITPANARFDPVTDYVTVRPDGSYRHYLRYLNASLGIKVSLLNVVAGYKEKRTWDLIPAVDVGYVRMISYKGSPAGNYISPGLSLAGEYRITERTCLRMNFKTTLFPDEFDGRVSENSFENNLALTVGISYKLGKERFHSKKKVNREKNRENETAVPFRGVSDTVYIERIIAADTIYIKAPMTGNPANEEPFMLASFLFAADSTAPRPYQELQFYAIAEYLKRNPARQIRLDAYADGRSGTETYNTRLAVARAKEVKHLLVSLYNVDESKLIENAVGVKARPFRKKALNRVVVAMVLPADAAYKYLAAYAKESKDENLNAAVKRIADILRQRKKEEKK